MDNRLFAPIPEGLSNGIEIKKKKKHFTAWLFDLVKSMFSFSIHSIVAQCWFACLVYLCYSYYSLTNFSHHIPYFLVRNMFFFFLKPLTGTSHNKYTIAIYEMLIFFCLPEFLSHLFECCFLPKPLSAFTDEMLFQCRWVVGTFHFILFNWQLMWEKSTIHYTPH